MIGSTRFNVTWMFAEKLLRVLVGVVVSAAVARYLGPETYGSLAVSIGIVSIAIAAANMGADHIHVSEFAQRDGVERAAFLGSALLVRLLWSMVCLLLFWVAMGWHGVSHRNVLNRRLAITIGEEADYERRLIKLLRWMFLLAATAAIINCAVVAVLAPLLLGPKFNEVAPIVFITSLSFLPLFSGTVQDLSIAHRRNTGTVLKKVLVGLPISAALYYLIVPTYGLRGAAVAMVLSYFCTAILLNIVLDKQFFRIQLRALGFSNV